MNLLVLVLYLLMMMLLPLRDLCLRVWTWNHTKGSVGVWVSITKKV